MHAKPFVFFSRVFRSRQLRHTREHSVSPYAGHQAESAVFCGERAVPRVVNGFVVVAIGRGLGVRVNEVRVGVEILQ